MITDCYDIETKPMIGLKDFYGEPKHIVDICLIIFSKIGVNAFASEFL